MFFNHLFLSILKLIHIKSCIVDIFGDLFSKSIEHSFAHNFIKNTQI
jgi:hypothetical protein